MKILAICGSARKSSSNEKILHLIASTWRDKLDIEVYSSLTDLPHFNPDIREEDTPETIQTLRRKIQESDGVIICTPEYIFSPPAALKNALEWMVSVNICAEKPFALIVASGLGEKTFESLTLILNTLSVKWNNETRLLIQGARSKVNEHGNFTDEHTKQSVENMMKSFLKLL